MNRFLAFAAFACVALAPAAAPAAEAAQGPSKDVPELQVLNHWVGKWDVEMAVKPNAGLPQGMRAKGTAAAEWVLDGRFVRQTTTLDPGDGSPPMKMISPMTYDPQRKVYRTWMFFSNGQVSESEGRWDEKTRTMTSTGRNPSTGATAAVKATFAADGTQTWSFVEKDPDGKLIAETTGTNTRRKG